MSIIENPQGFEKEKIIKKRKEKKNANIDSSE